MQKLKSIYITKVCPILVNEFLYTNFFEIPKINKVVISRGFGESCNSSKILESLLVELKNISGQKPILCKSKNSISNFKVKKGMPIGMFVTLHGDKMYSFLDRLINLSFPRMRDFNGLNIKGFDGFGNYNVGLSEQSIFPEIEYSSILKNKGMNITIVTTAKTDLESFSLLKGLGFPFCV
uniref:Large ribosomal subunit protein uL5c n=1 Tax=Euglena longa TaxID=3037 RepID=RK5_EUGLO|nr:ribosomal protein L5 [Euglena longa]P14757.1 RecName: Full=Large ribosomal subunit protein uL5c; AltName: Full=50S ribosomal protein L5, plastid [Euglena longa]CAC24576.1 ribosomal protein L5 [Euglena longa]